MGMRRTFTYAGFTNACTCAQAFSIGWARAQAKSRRICKSLIPDSRTFTENPTHINTHRSVRVISRRIPRVHTHTPKPSSISGFRAASPPPRVRRSVFGSVSMQVGGLLILTAGLARCTLMQHTPPLGVLYVPFSSPLSTLPALKSSLLCEQAPPNRRLKVNHASSGCFFYLIYLCFVFFLDAVFVTALCSHLNAGQLTSRRKHIPCFRTTLGIPEGCFKGFFFLFLRVLSFKHGHQTDSEALKARKNNIGDSNEGPGGLEGVSPFSF